MVREKGLLKDTPAIMLLLTIFEQGLTGILYIKREHILKVLYFSRGKLIWAISNSDVDKLENILAAKNLVPMETINTVKKQARVSDSIGKLLVEKGLITLEELIESSKIQLKRIIKSILKWKDGGFQFIKEALPERLLSLDLDITQFVVDYIVDEVDVSDIWKEIGTLQVEFIKNPNEQKVEKYHLSDKQKELLNSFDGETKLETILSRHSGGHRESLLKIIYFFMMAELLIKKQFDLSVLATFDEAKSIDEIVSNIDIDKDTTGEPAEDSKPMESIEPMEPMEPIDFMEPSELMEPKAPKAPVAPVEPVEPVEFMEPLELMEPVETVEHVELMESMESMEHVEPMEYREPIDRGKPEESATGQDDSYAFAREHEKSAGETFKDDLEELDSTPPGSEEQEQDAAQITPPGEIKEEKKRLKFFNIILILVFLILVMGGIILLILPMMESSDQVKNVVEKASQDKTKDTIKIEEKIPPVKEVTTPAGEIPGKTGTGVPVEKTGEKKPVITGTGQTPPTTAAAPGKTAEAYFLEGNFIAAGDAWKREIIKTGVKYAVLLELDCLKESVMNAYGRLSEKKDFYILNRIVGDKTCFLVMWGKFLTYEQAAEARTSTAIPTYFRQQKDPPRIVELAAYL